MIAVLFLRSTANPFHLALAQGWRLARRPRVRTVKTVGTREIHRRRRKTIAEASSSEFRPGTSDRMAVQNSDGSSRPSE
jgi:hypothetical protein